MTLNLPKLYVVLICRVLYFQTSPKENKSPNLWPITSILVCCIFGSTRLFVVAWCYSLDYYNIWSKIYLQKIDWTKFWKDASMRAFDKDCNNSLDFEKYGLQVKCLPITDLPIPMSLINRFLSDNRAQI